MLEHSSRLGVDLQPVGPLGLIAMDGCKPLGEKVNEYLVRWEKEPENADQVLLTYPAISAKASCWMPIARVSPRARARPCCGRASVDTTCTSSAT